MSCLLCAYQLWLRGYAPRAIDGQNERLNPSAILEGWKALGLPLPGA